MLNILQFSQYEIIFSNFYILTAFFVLSRESEVFILFFFILNDIHFMIKILRNIKQD